MANITYGNIWTNTTTTTNTADEWHAGWHNTTVPDPYVQWLKAIKMKSAPEKKTKKQGKVI